MRWLALAGLGIGLLGAGCATAPAINEEAFRVAKPRSILILPPLNDTSRIEATYAYLSVASEPFAERGYYVFPVAVIDEFFKQNGMPTAGEMHQVSPAKVREILGADTILYITILYFGGDYKIVDSTVKVKVRAKLVDSATGNALWTAEQQSELGGGSNQDSSLVAALVGAAVKRVAQSSTESARQAAQVNTRTLANQIPFGPRHPEFKGFGR